jgi:hypothetical protein
MFDSILVRNDFFYQSGGSIHDGEKLDPGDSTLYGSIVGAYST